MCFPAHQRPSVKGSTLKGKNLLPKEKELAPTPFRIPLFRREIKIVLTELKPLDVYLFSLIFTEQYMYIAEKENEYCSFHIKYTNVLGWLGKAKVSCILRQRGSQLILAYI